MQRIKILKEYIDKIIQNKEDEEDKKFAYQHLYAVAQNCALIAMKRKENVELAIMAGLLHDFYRYKTMIKENHAEKGSVLAREVLTGLNLTTNTETDLICNAIHNHMEKEKKFSSFDEVLIDADVLTQCLWKDPALINKEHKIRYTNLLTEFGIYL